VSQRESGQLSVRHYHYVQPVLKRGRISALRFLSTKPAAYQHWPCKQPCISAFDVMFDLCTSTGRSTQPAVRQHYCSCCLSMQCTSISHVACHCSAPAFPMFVIAVHQHWSRKQPSTALLLFFLVQHTRTGHSTCSVPALVMQAAVHQCC
jgi:hypothetical protein